MRTFAAFLTLTLVTALSAVAVDSPPASAATAPISFAVSSSQPISVFGQSINLFATVTGDTTTPTGTVDFLDGGSPLCTTRPLSGVGLAASATCTTAALAVGTHSITASYSGDATYSPALSTDYGPAFSQVVTAAATTAAVVDAPDPSVVSAPVTVTATVAVVAPGGGTPSGTVAFADGATPVSGCTAQPLTAGTATCSTSTLALGDHTLTATYAGTPSYLTSTSAPSTHTVGAASTTTAVVADDASTTWGAPVTFTATIAPVAPATVAPSSGTVAFASDGTTITGCATRTVSSGTATCTASTLAVGEHAITAHFAGVALYNASTSPAATQTVDPAPTIVTLGSDGSPSRFGQPVTFTATVTAPNATTPTGAVAFFVVRADHTRRWIATTSLSAGSATATVADLPVGTHTISAVYRGSPQFDAANATTTQRVMRAATATTVTSSPDPSVVAQRVVFHAAVSPTPPGSGTPAGTVAFFRLRNGASRLWLGTATLGGGTATFATTKLPAGTHQIVAVYRGDGGHSASDGTTSQTVHPA